MKGIENQTLVDIEHEQFIAVLECMKSLEQAFKKKGYKVYLNAPDANKNDVKNVNFVFDDFIKKGD